MHSWLVNGRAEQAVSPADRGLAYGDGLFETIAFRHQAPRFFDRHMSRLASGCRRLGIPPPVPAEVVEEIRHLAGTHEHGTVKVILTRGPGPRGYALPAEIDPTRIIGFEPGSASRKDPRATGVAVKYCRTPASSNRELAGMKTLNRLDNVLARAECRDPAIQEGLMFDADDHVVGGTMTNLFMVHAGCLLTPALAMAGVRGVMRDIVLEAAAAAGIPCRETSILRRDLCDTEELFLTNALIGLWPVSRCADRELRPGPVTRMLAAALRQRGVEECAA